MMWMIVLGVVIWISASIPVGIAMGRAIRKANHRAATMIVRARASKLNVNEQITLMENSLRGGSR